MDSTDLVHLITKKLSNSDFCFKVTNVDNETDKGLTVCNQQNFIFLNCVIKYLIVV